jgi:S-DNA-T family DNA segregation ATPase FtsK/SpoIIIE
VITPPTSHSAPVPAVRVWTVLTEAGPVDVEVSALDDACLGEVLPAIGDVVGRRVEGVWAGSLPLPADLPLRAPQLAHGSVLALQQQAAGPPESDGASAVELRVTGGPDAGRTVALTAGRHVVGRGAAATIRIADPDVSRRHLAVDVGRSGISITDLASTNGSELDGDPIGRDPRPWPAGAAVRIGTSTLVAGAPADQPAATDPAPGGRLRVRPAARLARPAEEVEIELPRPPDTPPRRRLAWAAVALPAVAGLVMAWVLGTPTFLFFALLSPLVALGTWSSERWSGRRTGRRAEAAHAVAVEDARARIAAAVAADLRAAEADHPDLARLVDAARRRSAQLWPRSAADADALTIRLGTGNGPTRVTVRDPDGGRIRQLARHRPVTADLRTGGLGVVGPRGPALRFLTGVVVQLAALHPPGELEFLLLLGSDRLDAWRWTRWLPHLDPRAVAVPATGGEAGDGGDEQLHGRLAALVARRRAAAAGGTEPGWLVVVVDGDLDARSSALLRAARDVRVVVLGLAPAPHLLPVQPEAVLRLTGETGGTADLHRRGEPDQHAVRVDGMAPEPAASFARTLAGLLRPSPTAVLPRRVRLLELPTRGRRLGTDGGATGSWIRDRRSLTASLGRAATGMVEIDLCRDGPHALVAGTTGAGKSELLQTLIAGLALHHPPDRCSFLLIDYKGGAAFADAVDLPHTVGVVSDLDARATGRALQSLTAELIRREEVLGRHGVSDIGDLPESVELARLVIVVDEFATLAEDLPEFVPGLVGIAQRGRSLGVHLVLATQRPAGVVSPEIRANCSLRICLRTTDEADSRDVLGTPHAAHLPADLPGRGFVRSGSEPPREIQVARVGGPAEPSGPVRPSAERWAWPAGILGAPTTGGPTPDRQSDLSRLVGALARVAERTGTARPHRPWHPPLPDLLHAADLPESAGNRLKIGLVDLPDGQRQEPLELDLTAGGAWLAVGGPRSGRTTLLQTVLTEAVHRFTPDRLHVHVIDTGGTLAARAAALPHTGTAIAGDDPLRTVRLVDRLGQEIAARRAGPGRGEHPLLLLIDGMETLGAVLDDADPGRGSAALHRLVRDGAAVGLTTVMTADRAVPGGRLAAMADRRLVLPMADPADYAVAGIAARAVPGHRPPGRALLAEGGVECQLAVPRELPNLDHRADPDAHGRRLRIAELPPDPVLPLPRPAADPAQPVHHLPIGPGDDEGDVVTVDLLRLGGLLVVGPPGSGRSAALDAFAAHLTAGGVPVLRVASRPLVDQRPSVPGATVSWADPADPTTVKEWVEALDGAPGVVLADDVGAPADAPALAALPTPGSVSGIGVVVASTAGQLAAHFQGAVAALRRARSGLLLCPGPGEADVVGTRLPRAPLPIRPGSGWLVVGGTPRRVQVARRRTGDAGPGPDAAPRPGAGQSSSSAGPISWLAYQASSCPSA